MTSNTKISALNPFLATALPAVRRTLACALLVGASVSVWSPLAAAALGCTRTIVLTSPLEGTQAASPATFTLTATAGGDCIGSVVQFKANGNTINSDFSAPYTYTWTNVAAGNYVITATYGTVTSAPIHVTSGTGGGGGNVAPTVTLTAPADGGTAAAPAAVTLRATASDYDGSVASVQFWSNGGLLGTDTVAPYNWPLTGLAAGTYQFTAVATDNLGLVTTSVQKTYMNRPAFRRHLGASLLMSPFELYRG